MKPISLFIFFIVSFVISCKKETSTDNNSRSSLSPIESSSSLAISECNYDYTKDSVGYALCHLTNVGQEAVINFLSQRSVVYEKIENQFDGEFNVLVKTLIDPNEGNLPSSTDLDLSLVAFEGINGDTLYPHIFIPNYEALKASNQIGQNDPVIVPYANQDPGSDESYDGYTIDSNGDLQLISTPVDSAFAANNEVWVIALNESVDNQGNLPPDYVSKTDAIINMRLDKVRIKDAKESWLSGKTEFHIRSFRAWWNGRYNGLSNGAIIDGNSLHATTDQKGFHIRSYKGNQINQQLTLSYPLQTNWSNSNYYSDLICYFYVLFEYDPWPASLRTVGLNIPSAPVAAPRVMYFRSSNGCYSWGTIYNTNVVTGTGTILQGQAHGRSHNFYFNSNTIEFNTVEY